MAVHNGQLVRRLLLRQGHWDEFNFCGRHDRPKIPRAKGLDLLGLAVLPQGGNAERLARLLHVARAIRRIGPCRRGEKHEGNSRSGN